MGATPSGDGAAPPGTARAPGPGSRRRACFLRWTPEGRFRRGGAWVGAAPAGTLLSSAEAEGALWGAAGAGPRAATTAPIQMLSSPARAIPRKSRSARDGARSLNSAKETALSAAISIRPRPGPPGLW